MKFILASHGELAKGLLNSVNMLLGPQTDIEAYGLYPKEEPSALEERLEGALEPEDEGNVIIFTDLYFGSPFNVVMRLSEHHDLYHITGTNLPVLIEALVARNSGATCEEICNAAIAAAEGSVKDVRKLIAQKDDVEEEDEEL